MFEHDKDISGYTTFGIPIKARLFAEYASVKELIRISRTDEYLENESYHIGGGSNLLFESDFDGLVLHSAIKGIKRYQKDENTVYVIAGAGEKWTDLVDYCVEEGLQGMECMAGIPGEAGASPVQNVGAYGQEAKDVIHNVECFDTYTREVVTLKAEDCGFAYRDSRFKHEWKGRYYVLRVSYKLRPSTECGELKYKALQDFADRLGRRPTIKEIRDEVIRLRNEKVPDPKRLGSAGSFFKNPILGKYFFEQEVLNRCADVRHIDLGDGTVKVPAGWLIEHAGLKGARVGGAEVYDKNCLVIVNRDHATAANVKELAERIIETVNEKYAIILNPEVNFIDTTIQVKVLGSGTSKGIPEATCGCEVCRSEDPHDKRMRASVLVRTMGLTLLIDASPDFRMQALRENLKHVDAVLLTHSHYDHVGGIDDLRPFCAFGDMPIFARKDVDGDLRRRLDYCFRDTLYPGVPKFDMQIIDNKPFMINGVEIMPIEVIHGKLPIYGYRIGKFAYVTDCKTISEEEKDKLYGLDVLILNALRETPHFSHLSIPEALELIKELKPKRAYLTHFCHHAGKHEAIAARLPEGIYPAYDGLEITIK